MQEEKAPCQVRSSPDLPAGKFQKRIGELGNCGPPQKKSCKVREGKDLPEVTKRRALEINCIYKSPQ